MSVTFNSSVPQQAKVQNFTASENKSDDKSKSTSNTKKAVLVAAGVGLTALCAYGIYAATKGRVKPSSVKPHIDTAPVANDSTNVANTVQEKLSKIVDDFKALPYDRNQELKEVEPTITQLKNGKYKIDIKSDNKQNILVCDDSGNFEKMIQINTLDMGVKDIGVFDGINNYAPDTHCIKSVTIHPNRKLDSGVDYKKIDIETNDFKGDITTKKYEDKILVIRDGHNPTTRDFRYDYTLARVSDGKPDLVYQSIRYGNDEKCFSFTPSKNVVKVAADDASAASEILQGMDNRFMQLFICKVPK